MKFFSRVILSVMSISLTAVLAFAGTATALNPRDVVPEVVALGIVPKVEKVTTKRLQNLTEKEDQYYLQITVGKVNAEQFQKLKALYGSKSQVPFDANKVYDLIDFLPPAVQAVVNTSFTYKRYDTEKMFDLPAEGPEYEGLWPIRKNGVSFYTNCWGTTIQTLNSLHPARPPQDTSYVLSWTDRYATTELLTDNQYSMTVAEKDLRSGDALIVAEKSPSVPDFNMLMHTAIVLGKNLVFEKTDTSENDPARLSLRQDVLNKYKRLFAANLHLEYRRFGGGKAPLKDLLQKQEFTPKQKEIMKGVNPEIPLDNLSFACETGFGGGCDPVVSEYQTVNVITSPKTGRGVISGKESVLRQFRDITQDP